MSARGFGSAIGAVSRNFVRTLDGVGVSVLGFGDSITDYASDSSATSTAFFDRGFLAWVRVVSNGRISFIDANNFGVAGDTTTQMIARLAPAVAAAQNVTFVTILGGTNDLGAKTAPSVITANLETIYQAFLATGAIIVAIPILPRTTWTGFTAGEITAGKQGIDSVNTWIRNRAATSGGRIVLADSFAPMLDAATGGVLTTMTYDGLHPNQLGCYTMANAVWASIQPLLPGNSIVPLMESPNDIWVATQNVRGNLLAGAWTLGSGGSIAGTGISGTSGASFGLSTNGTSQTGTVVLSVVAATDGGADWQVFTFASRTSATVEALLWRQNVVFASGKYAPGDVLWTGAEIKVDAGTVGISNAFVQLSEAPGTGSTNYDVRSLRGANETAPFDMPAYGPLRQSTETLTVRPVTGVGTQQLSFFFTITITSGGTATGVVRVRAPTIKAVVA